MIAATVNARLDPMRAALRARWQTLSVRERQGAAGAMTVLALWLVWAVAVAPAWRDIQALPPRLEALDLEFQLVQGMAAETRQLRATAPVAAAQSQAVLTAATMRLGDKAKISLQAGRAVLTVQGVSGEQLTGWLAEARAGARARAVEANLSQSGPGAYSGTLIVALGGEAR
jgi:general secretion pathway protein M